MTGIMTKDSWIVLAAALGMVVVAAMAVYLPQQRKVEAYRTTAVSHQATLAAEAQKVAVVPEMIRQVQALKARYGDFDRRLPKRQELHEFLKQVNATVARPGLANLSIEPSSPTTEEYFNTLPIGMKFRADYLNLAEFLGQLEGMERLSRVQRLILQHDEKSGELGVELQMSIFFTES